MAIPSILSAETTNADDGDGPATLLQAHEATMCSRCQHTSIDCE